MIDEDSDHRSNLFADAFAGLRQAACILEPIGYDRTIGRDWRYTAFNAAMQRLFKVDDLTGQVLRDMRPDIAPEWYADFERVVTNGAAETLIRQSQHYAKTLQVNLSPLQVDGRDAVLVQIWDITGKNLRAAAPSKGGPAPREREDERQQMLVNETQHRVRNLMSMVRSVARLSAPSHLKVDDYVDHLVGRMQAMGRTQSMLARLPGSRLDLAELVSEELLASAVNQDQCLAEGPEVGLCPHAAEIVTLAIHELATNSIKYGALGGKGDVRINWTICERDQKPWLTFIWQETSPRRAFIPLRKGFGTCLIEERIAYELRGEGRLQVLKTGVLAEFAFPLT